ncbi:MAG: hypothetical protein ABIU63_11470 [Chitinophagaceae bacterium]
MHFNFNDALGFTGVAMLLAAYLLNLLGKISKDGLLYILMNAAGGGLACLASYLINYLPFVLLEGVWMLVSLAALIRLLTRGKTVNR